jgi:HK97 family phage major capsid protein
VKGKIKMFKKRLQEILARKIEIRKLLSSGEKCDLTALKNELATLTTEETEINERSEIANSIQTGEIVTRSLTEERKVAVKDYGVDSAEYRSAYMKSLMGKDLNEVEQRAMTTATNSVGAVVPTQTMNKIIEKLEQAGVILPLVTRLNIPSNVVIPVEGTTNDVAWVSEGGENDKIDTINKVSLSAHQLIKTIEITAQVEKMSVDAFEAFIIAALVKKAKVAIDNAIINGSGKDDTATGILTSLTALKTATNAGYKYSDLMKILANVKSGYKQGSVFVMSTNTLYEKIANIENEVGDPIFKLETDGRFEGKLCGYPVVCYDNLEDGKVLFGNFEYYYFNFVQNFEIAKDTSIGFKSGKTCFRVIALADGNVALSEAFAVMEIAA